MAINQTLHQLNYFGCSGTHCVAVGLYLIALCEMRTAYKPANVGLFILSAILPILRHGAQTSTRVGDIQAVCVLNLCNVNQLRLKAP